MKNPLAHMRKELARAQRYLHFAEAAAELLETDGWKTVEDRLQAERAATLEQVLALEGGDDRRLGFLQGRIHTIDLLLRVPKFNASKISSLQKELAHLQSRIEQRKHMDIDREIPGWKDNLQEIQDFLHGAKT